jgi:two-component system cell cycle sensor histidine kinase/response regulator CckA
VSDVREAAVSLRASQFDALYHDHPDGVFALEATGELLRCNPRFEEITGYTAAELADGSAAGLISSEDREDFSVHLAAALAGRTRRFRARGTAKDGHPFRVEVTQLPLRDLDGEVIVVVVTVREVTGLEEAAEQAERSAGLMRIAGRLARFDAWTIDAETRVLHTSDDFQQVLGFSVPSGRPYTEALMTYSASQFDRMVDAIEACIATGEPIDVSRTLTMPDGAQRHVRSIGEAVRNEAGRIVRIQGAFYDVTEVVEGERHRQTLQERLQLTLSQIASGVFFFDSAWRFLYANETGSKYLRTTVEELLGHTLWELFPDAVDSSFGEAYRRTMTERVVTRTREFYAPLDAWFEATAYPTGDGLALQLHDVTEDQQTRLRLQETTERLRSQAALLDAARDAIMMRDLDHRITYWNHGAEEMFGWPAEEIVGQSVRDLLYADPTIFDIRTAEVLRAGYWEGELQKLTRDGRTILLDCRWQLVRDDEGRPVSIFAVDSDITEFRAAEERRYRVQRMESLGTLAGGIAHDLNNVLTPILIAAQLLSADERDERRRQLLVSVEKGAKRGADMIRQVLSFARGEEGQRRPVDAESVVEDLLAFCRDTVPKSVTVVSKVDGPLLPVMGDRTQLLQVLINLITNAVDAMPSGGNLTIHAANRPSDDGDRVVFAVIDTGTGMDEETLSRVFEPFYTTKDQGKGTGLGLSTSVSIVRGHGGVIEVQSRPGAGSRFTVSLPSSSLGETPAAPPAEAPEQAGGRGELILVVDDEDPVRMILRQALESAGYRALEAENGKVAIEVLEGQGAPVDLVVMDVMMPVMGGSATLDYLLDRHPGLPVIVASGFDAENREWGREDAARFLAKPFSIPELLSAVRETLDAAERVR